MYVGWRCGGMLLRSEERKNETRKDLRTFSCKLICMYWYAGWSLYRALTSSANDAAWCCAARVVSALR
jgi:hypothetical protein